MKDETAFINWLINIKGYKNKTSHDVISRIRRVEKLIKLPPVINAYTLYELDQNKEFLSFSLSVKSQMRRAIRLLQEYQEK